MGNLFGKQETLDTPLEKVFERDLDKLNKLLIILLNDDGTAFRNKSYTSKNADICNDYSFILASDLKKHLRIELAELHDAIHVIPRSEGDIVLKNDMRFTKHDICNVIVQHYKRILNLVMVIKNVFDVENKGDLSLAGILYRNIKVAGNLVEVRYCGSSQSSEPLSQSKKEQRSVDFALVKGMKPFVSDLLTTEEATRFKSHLSLLLQQEKDNTKTINRICENVLYDDNITAAMYRERLSELKCTKAPRILRQHAHSLKLVVPENNPILSFNMCSEKRKVLISYNSSDEEHKKLMSLIKRFKDQYAKHLEAIMQVLHMLLDIDYESGNASIKFITSTQLQAVEKATKIAIMTFYIQSIINYQDILKHAMSIRKKVDMSNAHTETV